MKKFDYIDTDAQLVALCQTLETKNWVALDTEFIRETTYFPKLCLIQVASDSVLACIDPFAIKDLAPLLAILKNKAILKVLHAAGQDMEVFYHVMQALPAPIFDTQLAASLLGFGDQVGYANLVKSLCQVDLDKSQTRTDWSRRPLSNKQIAYAINDVDYLGDLYLQLNQKLKQQNRLSWLQQESKLTIEKAGYPQEPENAWRRVKQRRQLNGKQLALLQKLASWREQEAMRQDTPRQWILADALLIDLCKTAANPQRTLQKVHSANQQITDTRRTIVAEIIESAKHAPPLSEPSQSSKLSILQEATLDYLMAAVKIRAHQYNISPSMLVTRDQLCTFVRSEQHIETLSAWRKQVIGDDLAAILNGDKFLIRNAKNGRLTISP